VIPLIVGTVLALAALAYVLWPLIAADGRGAQHVRPPQVPSDPVPAPPATAPSVEDPVEAEIRRARAQLRVCPTCGPRPEPGARYCSSCGAALA
jgi:hypothetical protein